MRKALAFFTILVSMIHIGNQIKEIFDTKDLTVSEFARRIDTSRENVYGIFKRKSIDTNLLIKISTVLDHNFFQYFIRKEEIYPEVTTLAKKLAASEKEIEYLKKINELLERENQKYKQEQERSRDADV